MLSLDLDPATAGVQSTLTVDVGQSFSVDLLLEDIEPTAPLQAFELDLSFDSFLLAATGLVEGGFLQGPFGTLIIEEDILAPDVNFAVTALGPSTTSGSGVLAGVTFSALDSGLTSLTFDDVILVSGVGASQVDITLDAINGGTLEIRDPAAAPLPGTLYLSLLGFLPLLGVVRRENERRRT